MPVAQELRGQATGAMHAPNAAVSESPSATIDDGRSPRGTAADRAGAGVAVPVAPLQANATSASGTPTATHRRPLSATMRSLYGH